MFEFETIRLAVLLAVLVMQIILMLGVFISAPRKPATISFGLFAFSTTLSTFSALLFSSSTEYFTVSLHVLLAYTGTIISLISFILLTSLRKKMLGAVLPATAAIFLISALTTFLLPILSIAYIDWIGYSFVLFALIPTSAAIIRHDLFNPDVISTQVISAVLILLLFANIFTYNGTGDLVLKGVLFIAAILFCGVLIVERIKEVREHKHSKRLTRKLRRANKKLKRLDTVKSDFVSITSHQLRTPLSVIKGQAALVLDGVFGPVSLKQRKIFEKILHSNSRLIKLVSDLMDLSRMEKGTLEFIIKPTDLNKLLSELVEEYKSRAKHKHLSFIYSPSTIPLVMLDPIKMASALANIIDNALKYTKQGRVTITTKQRDSVIEVAVIDSGIGLTSKERDAIFTQFRRGANAKEFVEGAGLGLYISKKIIDGHGGTLSVQSKGYGKGSTFLVTLPLSPGL